MRGAMPQDFATDGSVTASPLYAAHTAIHATFPAYRFAPSFFPDARRSAFLAVEFRMVLPEVFRDARILNGLE